jgi:hypothetical protein
MRTAQEIWDELQRIKADPRIGTRAYERRAHALWLEARVTGRERECYELFKAALDEDRRECRRVMAENGWAR